MWAGVDVGGRRKGFHTALVDGSRVRAFAHVPSVADAVALLEKWNPRLVAVDSPRSPAQDGKRSRACERRLAAAVCGIRYTPEQALLAGNPYYEWIQHGLELYEALAGGPWKIIECFPTASWTRWVGGRGKESRARWSRRALAAFALEGLARRESQDVRDAIAAALTARCYDEGAAEAFGDIVVPR